MIKPDVKVCQTVVTFAAEQLAAMGEDTAREIVQRDAAHRLAHFIIRQGSFSEVRQERRIAGGAVEFTLSVAVVHDDRTTSSYAASLDEAQLRGVRAACRRLRAIAAQTADSADPASSYALRVAADMVEHEAEAAHDRKPSWRSMHRIPYGQINSRRIDYLFEDGSVVRGGYGVRVVAKARPVVLLTDNIPAPPHTQTISTDEEWAIAWRPAL